MAVLGALGDLVLSLSADTAKFQSDLGKAHREAEKFGRDVGRALGVAVGAFLTFSAASGGLVKSQIDAADAAGKMAQKVGVSTEELSAYMVAAQLADVSNEQLQTGFTKLAKNQAEFVAGTGEAADALLTLGISQEEVKRLNGDTAKLFDLVAGKLAGFEDGANKTALAMKIFGKSGAELIPLINGLEATKNEAAALGAVIDKQTAAAAEEFNDNLTRMGIATRGIGLALARDLLPTLQSVSSEMVVLAKLVKDFSFVGDAFRVVWQTIAVLGANLAFVFKMVAGELTVIGAQLYALSRGDLAGFRLLGENWTKEAALARAELDAFEYRVLVLGSSARGATRDIHAFEQSLVRGAAPALRDAAAEAKALAEALKKAQEAAQQQLELQEMAYDDLLGASEALKNAEISRERAVMEMRKQATDAMVESARIAQEIAEEMVYTWDEQGNRLEMTREQYEILTKQEEEYEKNMRGSIGTLREAEKAGNEFGFTFNSQLEDAILNGKELRDVVRGLEMDIARMIIRKQVSEPLGNAVSGGLSDVLGNLFRGNNSGGPTSAAGMTGGTFADGGRPPVGKLSLVGERGPELFAPDSAGTIIPNHALGGVTIQNTYHIDSRSDRAAILMDIEAGSKRTLAAVRALQQRSGDSRI